MHDHHGLETFHIALALIIMAAYLTIPFTALRRIPLPASAKISGTLFFATCAITHLAIAAGFHASRWMIANDLIQAVSTIVFIAVLSRMVSHVLKRRRAKREV